MKLVADQEALRSKCYHPSGQFVEFSPTDVEASIPECFEKIVRKFPKRLAIDDGDRAFTYEELNQAANRIAHSIVEKSATSERTIALLFEQGAFVIAAILGVLKTGRIYVPLDPSIPAARISVMLQDSRAELLLTNSQNLLQARQLAQDGQQIINCDDLDTAKPVENLGRKIVATTPALILYTSGSTGKPKGVLHSQRNILVEASNYINDVRICPDDALSLCQSCSFANSIRNIYGALLSGAALFPYDLARRGIPPLAEWMQVHRITIFHTLETIIRRLLHTIAADATFPALRILRFGGEPSSGRDVKSFQRRFAPNCVLMNVIGSTETFTIRRYFVSPDGVEDDNKIPLGYGVPGKEIILLNEAGLAVDAGQIGEIAVRSAHLTLGYWRQPELTRAVFTLDPSGGAERLYMTGDLGMMRADGCLIHMGRKDFQIKIRGNRVEVTEIEAELLKLDAIRATVVHAQPNDAGEQRLIAYVVPDPAKVPTVTDLRRALAPRLPDYMMPSAFVFLKSIPVVPNGRVDRSALPPPLPARPELETAFVAARTSVEKALVGIWSEVLSLDEIGIDDDFFELGGHSLLAAKMFAALDEKFGRSYPLSLLLSSPTIRQLAEHYSRPQETRRKLISLVPLRSEGSQTPVFAVPGVFGNVLGFVELARELGEDRPFYALQSIGLDGLQPPLETIEAMVEAYIKEIRSVRNSGPYIIIGACFGATVAYEMARELMATGNEVLYLGLIDPNNLEFRTDDGTGRAYFTGWNKAHAIGNLLSSRIKAYTDELRDTAGHERLQFLLRKAVTVGATLAHHNKTTRLSREIHQLEVANANRRALRRYRREPLVGKLKTFEVFESNHSRNSRSAQVTLETMWSGKVSFHHCSARDSGDMLSNENAVDLARRIDGGIDTGRVSG